MRGPLDLLQEARALLANAAHWTVRSYARDRNGQPIHPWEREAVCWCTYGAPERHGISGQSVEACAFLRVAASKLFEEFPAHVNDVRGHFSVLRMYDRAIELAAAEVSS